MPDQYKKFKMIDDLYRREVAFAVDIDPTYRRFAKRESLRENINIMMS